MYLKYFGKTCHRRFSIFWRRKKVDRGSYNIVEPGTVSQLYKKVPDHVVKPSYYESGEPIELIKVPEIKNADQILKMKQSCALAANILREVEDYVNIGISTEDIDKFVYNLIVNKSAYPSPLNYKNFPKSVCTSVNNVACHGIPDNRKLQDGDIINVDITVFYQGYHGDCSKTFLIGNVDEIGVDLVKATKSCLGSAISICKPERRFNEIGGLIEKEARRLGFTVVPAFIGHGIGHYFHGPPDIIHTANYYPGVMKPGMTFTIEPVLSAGGEEVVILEDGWTAVTEDGARTAQFEHTVLITEDGVEILTLPSK